MTSCLTDFEAAHAASIADPDPTLVPIPPEKVPRILIGSVLRKPPEVLAAFAQTLGWQALRDKVKIDCLFLDDGEVATNPAVLAGATAGSTTVRRVAPSAGHEQYAQTTPDGTSRQWSPAAWHRVGALKNTIIQEALTGNYDYLWLVDADVLCGPETLQSLLDSDGPIVAGVYWTLWRRPTEHDAQFQHAGPQVWLRHPYLLDGQGWTEPDFRRTLISRQRTQVWGLGACTLISRVALEKGVNFTKFEELPPGPMSDGEDRHFCARASKLYLAMIADPWPDIYHAYHPQEYDQIPLMLSRLKVNGPEYKDELPHFGNLVSAKLTPLERNTGSVWYRGRLGSGDTLPEIETALASLSVGERQIVKVHFPAHYEYAPLRSTDQLVLVEMFDTKPYQLPPVINKELIASPVAYLDATTLTTEQVDSVLEGATEA